MSADEQQRAGIAQVLEKSALCLQQNPHAQKYKGHTQENLQKSVSVLPKCVYYRPQAYQQKYILDAFGNVQRFGLLPMKE
jgi:hypothetical protein